MEQNAAEAALESSVIMRAPPAPYLSAGEQLLGSPPAEGSMAHRLRQLEWESSAREEQLLKLSQGNEDLRKKAQDLEEVIRKLEEVIRALRNEV